MKPEHLAIILDRFQVLFAKPSSISQHQDVTVTSEVSADVMRDFIEATRGLAGTPSVNPTLPEFPRPLDD